MFFDAHSDILFDIITENHSLKYHIEELRGIRGAIINYFFKGNESHDEFLFVLQRIKEFHENELRNHEHHFVLGIEGLGPVKYLEDIDLLKQCHIKSVTLTWNDINRIGSGTFTKSSAGLSDFGKQVLERLYKHNIVVDLSHANEKTFFDVIEHFKGRVFVSHANAQAVAESERNLTDMQIKAVAKCGGIIGINAYKPFVGSPYNIGQIIKHINYIIALIGEKNVCLGFDFDYYLYNVAESGLIKNLRTPQQVNNLIIEMKKSGYSQEKISNVLFNNILRFLQSSLIL